MARSFFCLKKNKKQQPEPERDKKQPEYHFFPDGCHQ